MPSLERNSLFDRMSAFYPEQKVKFFNGRQKTTGRAKFLDY